MQKRKHKIGYQTSFQWWWQWKREDIWGLFRKFKILKSKGYILFTVEPNLDLVIDVEEAHGANEQVNGSSIQ